MSGRERNWWIVAGVLILIYCLFPIGWIISLSFKAPSDIANGQFLPTRFTWENYTLIITGDASELFLPALRNSFGICLIATAIACVLSMFCAYAIARLDFKGKRLILSTALAVAIFPVISIVTPLFDLWRLIGLYDTWLGLIIPYLSLTLRSSTRRSTPSAARARSRRRPWLRSPAAGSDGATNASVPGRYESSMRVARLESDRDARPLTVADTLAREGGRAAVHAHGRELRVQGIERRDRETESAPAAHLSRRAGPHPRDRPGVDRDRVAPGGSSHRDVEPALPERDIPHADMVPVRGELGREAQDARALRGAQPEQSAHERRHDHGLGPDLVVRGAAEGGEKIAGEQAR